MSFFHLRKIWMLSKYTFVGFCSQTMWCVFNRGTHLAVPVLSVQLDCRISLNSNSSYSDWDFTEITDYRYNFWMTPPVPQIVPVHTVQNQCSNAHPLSLQTHRYNGSSNSTSSQVKEWSRNLEYLHYDTWNLCGAWLCHRDFKGHLITWAGNEKKTQRPSNCIAFYLCKMYVWPVFRIRIARN